MSDPVIFTAGGAPAPPSWFIKKLKAFDHNLRVSWGLGLMNPFPGWVIERRIPDDMKERVYNQKHKDPNRPRYAHQELRDEHGYSGTRQFDMRPDWHAVYLVMNEFREPILELSENVIDYLRANYERTLLGFPELGRKHLLEDKRDQERRDRAKRERDLDRATEQVMENKYAIFSDVMGRSGQPAQVMEGTEL